jgi:hypothetical protein
MSIHFFDRHEEQAADVQRRRNFIERMERKLEVKEAMHRPLPRRPRAE